MTRVSVETTSSLPAPTLRSKAARDDVAAPREDFSSLIDDSAPRTPEPPKANPSDKADRTHAEDARDNTSAKADTKADAKADVGARTEDQTAVAAPSDLAPSAPKTDTAEADPVKTEPEPGTAIKPDADTSATTVDTPALVVIAPVVPVIVPQIAVTSTASPTPPAAEPAGPLSIAAAALAATAATLDAGKPQKPATAEPTPDAAAPADATAIALLAATTTAPKPATKAAATKSDTTPATDAVVISHAAPTDAPPAAPAGSAKPELTSTAAKPAAATAETPVAPAPREHHAATAPTVTTDTTAPAVTPLPSVGQSVTLAAAATPQQSVIASQTAAVPLNGLAMQIAATASSGKTSFDIRLDPAELGRIDVRLDVDRHGNVTSHLTVEKPETLAMLRQDAPQLQRALNDAGLQSSDKRIQFSLSDQSLSGQNNNPQNNPNGNSSDNARAMQRLVIADDDNLSIASAGRSYGRMLASSSGVDIRV